MTASSLRTGLVVLGLCALPSVAFAQSEEAPPVAVPPAAAAATGRQIRGTTSNIDTPAASSGVSRGVQAPGAPAGATIPGTRGLGSSEVGVPGSANSK